MKPTPSKKPLQGLSPLRLPAWCVRWILEMGRFLSCEVMPQRLPAWAVQWIAGFAILGMWAGFVNRFLPDWPVVRMVLKGVLVAAVVAWVVAFFITYGFLANAAVRQIDERERMLRDQARSATLHYVLFSLCFGSGASVLADQLGLPAESLGLGYFCHSLLMTTLLVPIWILARGRASETDLEVSDLGPPSTLSS